ncbi:unnamed protein product [Closterium sp. NIES-65]|nr:unnamed protein product [Closterium sp. NIES-65]
MPSVTRRRDHSRMSCPGTLHPPVSPNPSSPPPCPPVAKQSIIPTIIPYPMAHSTAGAAARPCPVPACAAACGLLEGERGEGEGGTTYNQLALHDAIDLLLLAHSPHTPRWGGGGDLEKRGWEKGGRTTSSYDQLTQHHAVCWHVVLIHGMWLGEETGGKSTGEREQRHHTSSPNTLPAPTSPLPHSHVPPPRPHLEEGVCNLAAGPPALTLHAHLSPPLRLVRPPRSSCHQHQPYLQAPLLATGARRLPSPWPHISLSPRPRLPVPQPHLEEGIGGLFAGEPALILYSHLPLPLRLARV